MENNQFRIFGIGYIIIFLFTLLRSKVITYTLAVFNTKKTIAYTRRIAITIILRLAIPTSGYFQLAFFV